MFKKYNEGIGAMKKYHIEEGKRLILEKMTVPFAIYQFIDNRIVTLLATDGLCDLLKLTREEVVELMDNDMYHDTHPDDLARVANASLRFAQGEQSYDVVYRSRSSRTKDYVMVHAKGDRVKAEDGTELIVTYYMPEGPYEESSKFRSKTESIQKRIQDRVNEEMHEESLIRENYYDKLTGLPSMTYFLTLSEAGQRAIQDDKKVPVTLFIDLTGMKSFNEKYGFEEGDRLLIEAAKVLKSNFSNENCGRFGQDHFAVYTKDEGLEDKLHKLVSDFEQINNGKNLPVRIGVYKNRFEKVSASIACDRAKIACDKERNTFASQIIYYDENMRQESLNKDYVLSHFEQAIRDRWIKVYYQPIVRTVNGLVCDEEALARWIDPARGMYNPADFIHVLEDAKLLYKMDLYMVDRIIEDMKRKECIGLKVVPVSINLSRHDFMLCDMVTEICSRLDKANISHSMINIEVTESVLGSNPEFIKKELQRFHDAGFKVWMDDFGSEYSSLNTLEGFDFDLIKFDMKFMRKFSLYGKNPIILNELMQMAIRLGLDTVAEGVERDDQVEFLREIGCDKLQGFYYSKPNPLEVVIDRYEAGIGIGFENTREAEYFENISKTSLTDPAITGSPDDIVYKYFNMIPMGIVEHKDDEYYVLRGNRTYNDFMRKAGLLEEDAYAFKERPMLRQPDINFRNAVELTAKTGLWVDITNGYEGGIAINAFVKKLAVNPVTGGMSVLVVILSFKEEDQ